MKKIFIIMALTELLIFNSDCLSAQTKNAVLETVPEKQEFFIYTGIGFPDFVYFGIGKTIFNNYSLSVIADVFPLSSNGEGIRASQGIGIKISRLFYNNLLGRSFFPIDNVSLEYSYGLNYGNTNIGNYKISLGSDKIDRTGINFSWAIGIALITENNKTPLVAPNFKMGLIYNF